MVGERWRRRRAIRLLAKANSLVAMRELALACVADSDPQVVEVAYDALSRQTEQTRIDAICRVWGESRKPNRLDSLLTEQDWLASEPVSVMVGTALHVNRLDAFHSADEQVVPHLLRHARAERSPYAGRARDALHALRSASARRAVCEAAALGNRTALDVAVREDYAAQDPQMRAALLFLAGEFDRYAALDFDGRLLHAFWRAAAPQSRDLLADHARTHGQLAWTKALLSHGRPFDEVSSDEWDTTLTLLIDRQRFGELSRLLAGAPPVLSVRILRTLAASGQELPDIESAVFGELVELAIQCDQPTPISVPIHWERQLTMDFDAGKAVYTSHPIAISSDGALCGRVGPGESFGLFWLPDGTPAVVPEHRLGKQAAYGVELTAVRDGGPMRLTHPIVHTSLDRLEIGGPFAAGSTGIECWVEGGFPHAMTPDGRRYAVLSAGDGFVWDLPGSSELKGWHGSDGSGYGIAVGISANGRYLAIAEMDGDVRLWDLSSRGQLATLRVSLRPGESIKRVTVSSDGEWVAVALRPDQPRNDVRLVRTSGASAWVEFGSCAGLSQLVITPDSRLLGLCDADGVRLWRLASGRLACTIPEANHSLALNARFAVGESGASAQAPTIRYQPRLLAEIHTPLEEFGMAELEHLWLLEARNTAAEQRWGRFIATLLRWRHQHDIELDVAATGNVPGEVDIELG